MAITSYKIQTSDYADKDVASLPVKPQISAAELQAAFDRLVKEVVVPKLNALIDALAGTSGADEIGKTVAGMTGTTVGALLAELNAGKASTANTALTGIPTAPTPEPTTNTAQVATTAFVQAVVDAAVFASGAADMTRATYDPQTKSQDIFAYADAAAKMTEYSANLTVAGWTEQSDGTYRQTVSVTGLAASGYGYIVSPAPASFAAYGENGVYMDDVTTANTAVFHAAAKPAAALTAQILKIGVGE